MPLTIYGFFFFLHVSTQLILASLNYCIGCLLCTRHSVFTYLNQCNLYNTRQALLLTYSIYIYEKTKAQSLNQLPENVHSTDRMESMMSYSTQPAQSRLWRQLI